ncbi:hypothetical protein FGO68_gene735 [Halteria grandinella]|uniref:Secreted protein n=1 Tax=Halteria grandinella TaxID=5974 RepID=A0A8J8NRP1_HALGN|nr:hypothetical protein FGO68_gene735 [Halteria grandinella]
MVVLIMCVLLSVFCVSSQSINTYSTPHMFASFHPLGGQILPFINGHFDILGGVCAPVLSPQRIQGPFNSLRSS